MEMMEFLTGLINNCGFPIACCVFLAIFINTTMKQFAKVIESNTKAIRELINKLE